MAASSGIRGFLSELRRRSVFKVAGVYAVVAWLVVQIAETTFPHLGLPDWSITLVIVLVLLGSPLALVSAWAFDLTPEGIVRTPPASGETTAWKPTERRTTRHAADGAADAGDIRSVAVLPFVDLSAERDQEYFGDGIAEELLGVMARVEGLRVPARTSSFAFKGQNVSVREIGEKLGVDALLEGSIRKSGSRLRISAQLVSVDEGYQIWSESYDRELRDILALQEEIARAIMAALRVRIAGGRDRIPADRFTGDAEAFRLYLKGRFFWNKGSEESLRTAIELFQQALEEDPHHARSHAGLADAWIELGTHTYVDPRVAYPRARAAAERALELEPGLAEAHASLGRVALTHDWDLERAEHELRRATQLNPGSSIAHQHYARCLLILGRMDDAIREARRAVDIDPLSVAALNLLGSVSSGARRYPQAVQQLRASLQLDPDQFSAYYHLAFTHAYAGEHDDAIAAAKRAAEIAGRDMFSLGALGYAYAAAGERERAKEILSKMEAVASETYVCPYDIAVIYAGLGEKGRALAWLERGLVDHDHAMLFLNADPALDPLREAPEFQRLARRVGLSAPASPRALTTP